MVPGGSKLGAQRLGAFPLHDTNTGVEHGHDRSRPGYRRSLQRQGHNDQRQQRQGEQWINDRHVVPGNSHVRERPEQLGAVGRAGVDHPVGRVAKEGIEVSLPERDSPVDNEPADGGADQGADGNEGKGVGELAVVFQEQQRISLGPEQHVDVRGHAGQTANPGGDRKSLALRRRLCKQSTDGALCQWVHLCKSCNSNILSPLFFHEDLAMLTVYIDFKSPYAFIAKNATFALEAQYGITIDWQPLTLNIGSYLGTAKKDSTGKVTESTRSPRQWLAVKYAYMDARRYAKLQGLTLRGTQKIWDSSLAAIGLMWASRDPSGLRAYIDSTYEKFWRRELDIEDEQVIVAQLAEAGINTAGFLDYLHGEGREKHDVLQDEILDAGYFGVPTYVIDGEAYFGREHLPRVRWHLEGGKGPLPDIANDTVLPRVTV